MNICQLLVPVLPLISNDAKLQWHLQMSIPQNPLLLEAVLCTGILCEARGIE